MEQAGSDIDVVIILGGKISVHLNSKDTVFVLRVLPEPGQDIAAIFLRIT
jgi:hypothetical protein